MLPCYAAVDHQSIPTFKVSKNCRATESPATNLKRGITSRRFWVPHAFRVRSSAKLSAGKSRCQHSSEMFETNDAMNFTKHSPGNAARVFDHHLYVMAALSSQPASHYRLCGVVTSRAPIPFSAHPRSIDGGSSPDNLPLATGSGTKAMAEAMRAKKVAICLYMVAIEGEKLTGCWFGPVERRRKARKAKTRTQKPGGHCEIARKSSSCQHLLQAIRVFPGKRTAVISILEGIPRDQRGYRYGGTTS